MLNSYTTVEYADEYLAQYLGAEAWFAADLDVRQKALVTASAAIDALARNFPGFKSRKTDPNQPLQFPRKPDAEIPSEVRNACCHEALYMARLAADKSAQRRADSIRQGVRSVSIGDVSESYVAAGELKKSNELLRSEMASNLIRPFLNLRGGYPTI